MDKAHVIGMGEVGRRLADALERGGCSVSRVTRDTGWEAAVDTADRAPRIVAVREEALAAVLDRLPVELRRDTVLVQNGFLEPVHGDLSETTRGLVWFTSKGDFYRVLCQTPFYGPHAEALVAGLDDGGIPVEHIADRDTFLRAMIVKGIWNCVVGLPLAVHEIDLATYLAERQNELYALVAESAAAASAEYGVSVSAGVTLSAIAATTGDLGWVRGGAKALNWRNGAIALFGRRHGVPTPVNDELLAAVGHRVDTP